MRDQELRSLFTIVEAVLNSRPLVPISEDFTDLSLLTPNHFTVGNCSPMRIKVPGEVVGKSVT